MPNIQQVATYRALDNWLATPQGQLISKAFEDELKPFRDLVKGDYLLQLGSSGLAPWETLFKPSKTWLASPDPSNKKADFFSSYHQLPIDRASVDIVVAPLALEAYSDQLQLIDEIDRVLSSMGYVIILGLNPWGLWNLSSTIRGFQCYDGVRPWTHSPFNINRLFLQRGYRQCLLKGFWYLPPVNSEKGLKRLGFLNAVGKMLWPFPAGFYCYIAQKYEPDYLLLTETPVEEALSLDYQSGFQPIARESKF